MRKQELLHVHGLLGEVRSHVEERTTGSIETSGYDEIDTRPTSIQRSKSDHEEAVLTLADDIATSVEGNSDRTLTPRE
jgi:hypothetical protein